MNITTDLRVQYTVLETISAGLAGTSSQAIKFEDNVLYTLGSGTDALQADLHWEQKEVVLAGGGSTTYTLSALTDGLGRSVALVGVKYLVIRVLARTLGDYLVVGNAASNPWAAPFGSSGHTAKVYTTLALFADDDDKYAVTSGSSDQLKIANPGSNAITFRIGIVGVSA